MPSEVDYTKRKVLADAMRAKLKAHRQALAMEKTPEVERPYDGRPLGFRERPAGYTDALLKSFAARPLRDQ